MRRCRKSQRTRAGVSLSGGVGFSHGLRRSAASGRASRSWVKAARISQVQRSAASGLRIFGLNNMLGGGITEREPSTNDDSGDEHGSNRDPAQDIDDIVAYAKSRGWPVKPGQRAPAIANRLSIDWLSENLERRIGVEGYAWTSGSSMSHGEHAADTASWIEVIPRVGPGFTGPLDGAMKMDGRSIGYRVSQTPDNVYRVATYWLNP